MKNQLQINSTIFQLAELFRDLVPFVFEILGKSNENTRFETFNDIGRLRVDSAATGFFSFRNEEFFYWIFMKITHRDNSVGAKSLHQEFEVQIKKSDVPVFQIFGEHFEAGHEISVWNELKKLKSLEVEAEENHIIFAENFVQKVTEQLEITK